MRDRCLVILSVTTLLVVSMAAQVQVRGTVEIVGDKRLVRDRSGAVVWLQPRVPESAGALESKTYRLTQEDKHFSPHLLVVPLGSAVEFPNHDLFFHNVFSVYDGTRFDLGLYESGSSKLVRFNRPGPSYIFCNIHPEMSAVVLALPTKYFAVTDASGEFTLANVMPGEYELRIWYERSNTEELRRVSRTVRVGDSAVRIAAITIRQAPSLADGHKNKFGQEYEPEPSYKSP